MGATVAKTAVEQGMDAIVNDPAMRRAAWKDLMQRGVVVTIRMSRWRPQAALTPADLGLPVLEREQQRQLERLMPLGKKLLVTPDWFAKLTTAEAGPRAVLYKYSYGVLTATTRFVPVTAYAIWKAEHEKAVAAFYASRDGLLDAWDEIETELAREYTVAADRAYDQMARLPGELRERVPKEVLAMSRAEFTRGFVEGVLALRPNRQQVFDSFQVRVELEYLDPSMGEAATGDAALDRDLATAMGRRRERLADGFISDVIGQMQAIVYETAEGILESVEKSGRVSGSGARGLKALAERGAVLNFYGDQELALILARVRGIADQDAKDRDPVAIASVMRAIATIARRQLGEVGRRPKGSAAGLGVPDAPTDEQVRGARLELGLIAPEEEATIEVPQRRRGAVEMTAADDAPALPARGRRRRAVSEEAVA